MLSTESLRVLRVPKDNRRTDLFSFPFSAWAYPAEHVNVRSFLNLLHLKLELQLIEDLYRSYFTSVDVQEGVFINFCVFMCFFCTYV